MIESKLERNPAALLCIDEPTARLERDDAHRVLERLTEIAGLRAVLMVTHNQAQAETFADTVLLVAAGQVQEHTPAKTFFSDPSSDAGRQFVGTGGVALAGPDTPMRHLAPEERAARVDVDLELERDTQAQEPLWVLNEKLGIFWPKDPVCLDQTEIDTLARHGVTAVISVSDSNPPELDTLVEAGMVPVWIPLAEQDRTPAADHAPICLECQRLLDGGEKVIVLATGDTQLGECTIASQLVYAGLPADKATQVAQRMLGDAPLSMENEQLLWDLELHLDLADEGVADRPARRGRRSKKNVAKGSLKTFKASGATPSPDARP